MSTKVEIFGGRFWPCLKSIIICLCKDMRKTSTKVEILVDVFCQTLFRKFDENLIKIGNIHLGSKMKTIHF